MKHAVYVVVGLSLSLSACDQMDYLYKEIKRAGYIQYRTPLEHAGAGTLVGNSPSKMSLVASPESCFPSQLADGTSTNLYRVDSSALPQRRYELKIDSSLSSKFADFLILGNPLMSGQLKFEKYTSISMAMEGVEVHYLDSIALYDFYRSHMSAPCKAYLEQVGFIIQALRAEKTSFRFYDRTGVALALTAEQIESFIDLGVDIQFQIVNETTLVITTPKYMGYQLGRLTLEDDGLVLYRAAEVKQDRYIFKSIGLFDAPEDTGSATFRVQSEEDLEVELPESLQIDAHSVYRRTLY